LPEDLAALGIGLASGGADVAKGCCVAVISDAIYYIWRKRFDWIAVQYNNVDVNFFDRFMFNMLGFLINS
jgi:hypothetical protein